MLRWYSYEWSLFALIWIIGAGNAKRTARRGSLWTAIVHGSLLALASLLLFRPGLFARLDARFVPDTVGALVSGLMLTGVGLGFAIWARLRLGRNWSGAVTTIKEDHRLIREGPYRLVRHPIYFGILVAMAGTAVGYGRVACLIALPIAVLAFWIKSRAEERLLMSQFGPQYVAYQREVKAFIPGLL